MKHRKPRSWEIIKGLVDGMSWYPPDFYRAVARELIQLRRRVRALEQREKERLP